MLAALFARQAFFVWYCSLRLISRELPDNARLPRNARKDRSMLQDIACNRLRKQPQKRRL
ncbi:hypothetical protein AR437_10195 [Christensenella hongkongensis]|nr:hypothetical protein AR437_10195 [Christensenella hongkongensis]